MFSCQYTNREPNHDVHYLSLNWKLTISLRLIDLLMDLRISHLFSPVMGLYICATISGFFYIYIRLFIWKISTQKLMICSLRNITASAFFSCSKDTIPLWSVTFPVIEIGWLASLSNLWRSLFVQRIHCKNILPQL